ncbi:putative Momilactone A synthase [Cocos nucifera]|uniref:Putative Momilactone A synthase n=1 Tax=Cocos nucifera TaxID=13894 RepID=A0A8K0I090_COCNU|nr:putative Momilactone A synthase [Cocos nucifera]
MSSMAAVIGGVASHAYTCSKKAVVALTTNTATELGRFGIRVNCVSPAGVATSVTTSCAGLSEEAFEEAMGRVANLKGVAFKEEDIANAVLYLASDDSRYMSGHNLVVVDGGSSIVNPPFEDFSGFSDEQNFV